MALIGRLMAQKIPVGPRFPEYPITLIRFFPDGKRQSTLRITLLDTSDNLLHPLIRVIWIFSSLQYERAKSQLISPGAALQNLFPGEPVSLCIVITLPYPAVITIIFTIICKFNQTTYINIFAIYFFSYTISCLKK